MQHAHPHEPADREKSNIPWYEQPEYRALAALRQGFIRAGLPRAPAPDPDACARLTSFWMLYELGNVLDELERRSRLGAFFWVTVRSTEVRPGTVVLEIVTEPKLECITAPE